MNEEMNTWINKRVKELIKNENVKINEKIQDWSICLIYLWERAGPAPIVYMPGMIIVTGRAGNLSLKINRTAALIFYVCIYFYIFHFLLIHLLICLFTYSFFMNFFIHLLIHHLLIHHLWTHPFILFTIFVVGHTF